MKKKVCVVCSFNTFLIHFILWWYFQTSEGETAHSVDSVISVDTSTVHFDNNGDEGEIPVAITSLFSRPTLKNVKQFLTFHPNQPKFSKDGTELPFAKANIEKVFFREKIKREWITYCEINKSLYCYICLMYVKDDNSTAPFTSKTGFNDWKHVHQRIGEHEQSKMHKESCKNFMREQKGRSIQNLININLLNEHKLQVQKRRLVFTRMVQIVKFISKQGLSFRGHRNESAYFLSDRSANHGNFLETVLLIAENDLVLKEHVNKAIEISAIRLQQKKSKGRGKFTTFLSKNTFLNILSEIKSIILKNIAKKISEAGMFSVMMDSTMDVACFDQCVVCVRFLNTEAVVEERVIALKKVDSSTGIELFKLLQNTLQENGVNLANCIADSFDGAANMSGEYNGVTAHLQGVNSTHIHTWCYAHIFNLVVTDCTTCIVPSISLFGLIQEGYNFFHESYKRLKVYDGTGSALKLSSIGATRWRSKNDALCKIFGSYNTWKTSEPVRYTAVYKNVVPALKKIADCTEFSAEIRHKANSLLNRFLSFEVILTAMTYLRIFEKTTPVSDYLQTKGLHFVQAWRQISMVTSSLKKIQRDFNSVYENAQNFVKIMSSELGDEFCIENELPQKRQKQMNTPDRKKNYEINTHNTILDTIINKIEDRFKKNGELYGDVECFDPRRFKLILENGLPDNSLKKICELMKFSDENEEQLRKELLSFAEFFPRIKQDSFEDVYALTPSNEFEFSRIVDCSDESENSDYEETQHDNNVQACNNCLSCVILLLKKYRMYSIEYELLYKVYKYLLTLPMTQVSCERSFSKLKLIKTRLRANLKQENLEAFFICNNEPDLLQDVSEEEVINNVCVKSAELASLLQA